MTVTAASWILITIVTFKTDGSSHQTVAKFKTEQECISEMLDYDCEVRLKNARYFCKKACAKIGESHTLKTITINADHGPDFLSEDI